MNPWRLLMKRLAIAVSALAASTPLLSAPPPVEAGEYVGKVRVTESSYPEARSSSRDLDAKAVIEKDGAITLTTIVPERSGGAEKSALVNRAVPLRPAEITITIPLDNPPPSASPATGVVHPTTPAPAQPEANYLVDGKHRAQVTGEGNLVRLVYANPPTTIEKREGGNLNVEIQPKSTTFEFTLRKRQ